METKMVGQEISRKNMMEPVCNPKKSVAVDVVDCPSRPVPSLQAQLGTLVLIARTLGALVDDLLQIYTPLYLEELKNGHHE